MSGFLPHLPLSDKVNQLFIRMSILEEIGIVVKKIPIEIYRTCNISEVDRVLLLGGARLFYQQFGAFLLNYPGLGGTLTTRWAVCDCDNNQSENLPVCEKILQEKKLEMDNLHPTGCQCPSCCPQQPQTTQDDLSQDFDFLLAYPTLPPHQNIPSSEQYFQRLYPPPDNLGLTTSYPGSSYTTNMDPYPQYHQQFNQITTEPSLANLGSNNQTYESYPSIPTLPTIPTTYNPEDQPSTSTGITGSDQQTGCGGRRSKKTCAHCSKVFVHTGDYRKHMRKHTKEKPYQCNQCGKYFAHTSNLHRHVRSHEGVRPHKCELCGKEFGRKDKLDSHKKCSKSCRDKKSDRQ